MAIVQRALRAEIAQDAVGDAVGELVAAVAVGEQAAERPDHRIDRLPAERVQPVDQRDLAAEPRRLQRGRHARDAGADHADVDADLPRRGRAVAPHDPGGGLDGLGSEADAIVGKSRLVLRIIVACGGALFYKSPGRCRGAVNRGRSGAWRRGKKQRDARPPADSSRRSNASRASSAAWCRRTTSAPRWSTTSPAWSAPRFSKACGGPGSDLNSVELARRFRTSRTPTREAVVILEKEGLVEILPRRRPRVADLSISEIREIYRVRAAMLGLIAAEVARLATDEEIAELRVHPARDGAHRRGASDRDGYYWGNVAFHERFADLARNKTLQRILESLALRSLRLRRLTLSSAGRMQRSLADHARLVGALEDRDGELASALIKANVLGALKLLEQLLADGDDKAKS